MNRGDGIFLIADSELKLLERKPFHAEGLLQQALATYPAVLAGGMTDRDGARRLLLIANEMGVPKNDGGSAVWSVDHLFVDAAGVPVIVEVKRSSDTRIRREVVGQMLDYAANGVRYWPVAELRQRVHDRAAAQGTDGDTALEEFQQELSADEFWETVAANLASGRVRMVFVADELPDELIAIIEFMNEQMSPAEVLGVAVPQYVGEGVQVLVPSLVGRTSAAVATGPYAINLGRRGRMLVT